MVPFAWLKFQLLLFIFPCWKGVVMVIVSTAPAASGLSSVPSPAATMLPPLSNYVSATFSRAIGALATFLMRIVVTTLSPFFLVTGWVNSTSA